VVDQVVVVLRQELELEDPVVELPALREHLACALELLPPVPAKRLPRELLFRQPSMFLTGL
jgi:hypothetical protein